MEHREGTFGGVRRANIYYQSWHPEGDSRAALLIVHGLAEHSGRYMNLVNHFVPSGFAVYGMDHVGHGKSEGTRLYVERFEDYTKTLHLFLDMVKRFEPGKRLFLVGHSMGGLISTVFLPDHQDELTAAVLSAPAVKLSVDISALTAFVGKLASALFPKLGIMQLEAEGVSRDPAVVQAYKDDPLVYTDKITARLAAELVKTAARVPLEAKRITLPVLLVQGGADKLVDPEGARTLYDLIGSSDKSIKIYDGLYHEVFNEPEHDRVLADVNEWLKGRLHETAGLEEKTDGGES